MRLALQRHAQGGVDLHDCLIGAPAARHQAHALTFDAKASKELGVELLR